MSSARVIVVGAGIFGVTSALELQQRGYQVQLLDPGPLPHPEASSTDISKVIRMDYGADEFTMALMEQALQGWHAWNSSWSPPLYHQVGFLLLTRRSLAAGTFEGDSYQTLLDRGHRPERLDGAAIASRFPPWSQGGFRDGYFNPEAGWAESGQVVSKLLDEAKANGVKLMAGLAVAGLLLEGSRVIGVTTEAGVIEADWVVLAAGAWSPGLLPALQNKVWPVGQPVIHFEAPQISAYQPPEFPPWAADISHTGWYGFPAQDDGALKIANHGPGRRLVPGTGASLSDQEERRFREFLKDSLPAVAGTSRLYSRICFYSDSWDGDFYIDRVPGYQGLVVATGGSGHGFKFAPVLGPLIADALEGEPNPNLARYCWREAGQLRHEQARNS